MEQLDPKFVDKNFNKVLEVVRETCAQTSSRFEGQIKEVLVEQVNDHMDGYVTGRMDNNILVHFPGTPDLIGSFVNVKLDEAKGFYYIGKLAE
jgi:tRNA-2-methylthio-N6-dimethylallyladenosine synthase